MAYTHPGKPGAACGSGCVSQGREMISCPLRWHHRRSPAGALSRRTCLFPGAQATTAHL